MAFQPFGGRKSARITDCPRITLADSIKIVNSGKLTDGVRLFTLIKFLFLRAKTGKLLIFATENQKNRISVFCDYIFRDATNKNF
jgi:hypothetical protein